MDPPSLDLPWMWFLSCFLPWWGVLYLPHSWTIHNHKLFCRFLQTHRSNNYSPWLYVCCCCLQTCCAICLYCMFSPHCHCSQSNTWKINFLLYECFNIKHTKAAVSPCSLCWKTNLLIYTSHVKKAWPPAMWCIFKHYRCQVRWSLRPVWCIIFLMILQQPQNIQAECIIHVVWGRVNISY